MLANLFSNRWFVYIMLTVLVILDLYGVSLLATGVTASIWVAWTVFFVLPVVIGLTMLLGAHFSQESMGGLKIVLYTVVIFLGGIMLLMLL